jgi:hypothetical protein
VGEMQARLRKAVQNGTCRLLLIICVDHHSTCSSVNHFVGTRACGLHGHRKVSGEHHEVVLKGQ